MTPSIRSAPTPACRVVVLTGDGRRVLLRARPPRLRNGPRSEGLGAKAAGDGRPTAHRPPHPPPPFASPAGHRRGERAGHGGGFALVLGSDVRFASTSARFGAAFVRIGLSACDIGTSWLLPRLVGAGRAHELMLTGRVFDAAEAERIGLVLEVVPDDVLLERAYAEAELIMAELAVRRVDDQGRDVGGSGDAGPAGRHRLENRTQIMISGGADQREAMTAVMTKRPPTYTFD